MERRSVIVVCIVVAFLGVLSAILGFAAESKRIKKEDVVIMRDGTCIFPSRPALGLGLVSALLLLVAQILISAFAGCICCKKNAPSGSRFCVGVTCYVISWVTFVLAFLLMVSGAAISRSHTVYSGDCYVIKGGVFAGGAVLSLATVILGIVYLLIANSPQPLAPHYGQEIPMGQPQMNAPPVFVHEDTYRRQQYP